MCLFVIDSPTLLQHAATSGASGFSQGLLGQVEAALAELYFLVAPHDCIVESGVHVAGVFPEDTHASSVLQASLFPTPQLDEDVRSAASEVVAQVPAPKPAAHVSVVVVEGCVQRRRRRRWRRRSKWKKV